MLRACLRVPDGVLNGGLGHAMPANPRQQPWNVASTLNLPAQQRRSKVAARHVPRRVDRLFVVERMFASRTLTPTFDAVAFDGHEQDSALGRTPEAGLEEVH